MRIALCVVAALYALLSIVAAGAQLRTEKNRDTSLYMLSGGLFLFAAVLWYGIGMPLAWAAALGGCLLIGAAALINGKRGEFHALHHVVRAALTVLLVLGFAVL